MSVRLDMQWLNTKPAAETTERSGNVPQEIDPSCLVDQTPARLGLSKKWNSEEEKKKSGRG